MIPLPEDRYDEDISPEYFFVSLLIGIVVLVAFIAVFF